MGDVDYCACGMAAVARCTQCGNPLCNDHIRRRSSGVICEECETRRETELDMAIANRPVGLDQIVEGLRRATGSSNPDQKFEELRAAGVPFERPTLIQQIQSLYELKPPTFKRQEVWCYSYVKKWVPINRHKYEPQMDLVGHIDALPITCEDPDYERSRRLKIFLFPNGAVLRDTVTAYRGVQIGRPKQLETIRPTIENGLFFRELAGARSAQEHQQAVQEARRHLAQLAAAAAPQANDVWNDEYPEQVKNNFPELPDRLLDVWTRASRGNDWSTPAL